MKDNGTVNVSKSIDLLASTNIFVTEQRFHKKMTRGKAKCKNLQFYVL